jgi:hypothetical protein
MINIDFVTPEFEIAKKILKLSQDKILKSLLLSNKKIV